MPKLLDVSPYEMRDWLTCPVLWYLSKRWVPTQDDKSRRIIGQAVAAGLAQAFHSIVGSRISEPLSLEEAVQVASRILDHQWEESPEWTVEGAREITRKSLKVGLSKRDLIGSGMVVAVEQDLGGVRPDLIVRLATGGLRIVDHKWHASLQGHWIQSRLNQQETDIQLWEYAVRGQDHYGEPVVEVGHHHITVAPRMDAWFEPAIVNPVRLGLYRRDRELWLHQMARDRESGMPAGRWTACQSKDENYGRCRMYDACHIYDRRPKLMRAFYTEVTR